MAVATTQVSAYEMYYKSGTEWGVRFSGVYPNDLYHQEVRTFEMVDGEEIDGYKTIALCKSDNGEKKVTQSIRTDRDRVYCLDNLESRNWLLAYDFSLEVDQTCDLYLLNYNYYPHTYGYSVKCTDIHESTDNPGFEVMDMEQMRDEIKHEWIKGIGSYCGPCDYYLAGLVGGGGKLIWVYDNGKLVYLAPEDIFFKEKAKWITKVKPGNAPEYTETIRLAAGEKIGGFETLRMLSSIDGKDEKTIGNIRTEGQKVYFSTEANPSQWYLIYDFNLRPGQDCRYYSVMADGSEPREAGAKCTEIADYELAPVTKVQLDNGKTWLRGVGSSTGPVTTPDAETTLTELWIGNSLRFKFVDDVAIETVDSDADYSFSIDNRTLTTSGEVPASVYNVDGRLVSAGESVTLNSPGLYIVRQGRNVRKVLVR